MTLKRILRSVYLIAAGLAAVTSCASVPISTRSRPTLGGPGSSPVGRARRPALPERPPPPVVTSPMKGDPSAEALSEARLVPTTCDKATGEQVDVRISAMRTAVDQAFKEWHDAQPDCWAEDRERYQMLLEEQRTPMARPTSAYGSGSGSLGAIGHLGAGAGFGPTVRSATTMAAPPKPAPAAEKRKDSANATAKSASGTNNQVAGVDEADIVKTDGQYVYLASNGALRIAVALQPRIVSVTKVEGTARELFVEGDRAVVYTSVGHPRPRCTYGYDCAFGGDGSSTTVNVFDIKDRAAPKLVRQMELSGSLVAARRIGNAVHTVVADHDIQGPPFPTWPPELEMCGTVEAKVRAKFAKLKVDNERLIRGKTSSFPTLRVGGATRALCDGLLRTAIPDGQAFTTVMSFDLANDRTAPTTATVQSRPGAVFASRDALYLSVVHGRNAPSRWYSSYSSASEVSEIHKFRIGEAPISTRYVGSGLVPGHVLNQFAMDEWYGYLRVATSKGRVPDPRAESVVSVLTEAKGGNLVRVGAIDHIAPGEDIRAVRFEDDRGYVVTFKKTDPLFVLDLYQPAHPSVLGELKIPGFSTYIHRIDPEHLLSIGFDANDHGAFAYFDGVILQLFDVKNPTDPKLLHKEKIGSRGSSSEAATDHLAFNYFADRGLLAVPMTICEGGGDGRNGDTLAFSGLLVYEVDTERGFTRLGGVDHGTRGANCGAWWSNANSVVKRSVFLDDLVYSITSEQVKVQRMSRFGTDVASLSLLP